MKPNEVIEITNVPYNENDLPRESELFFARLSPCDDGTHALDIIATSFLSKILETLPESEQDILCAQVIESVGHVLENYKQGARKKQSWSI